MYLIHVFPSSPAFKSHSFYDAEITLSNSPTCHAEYSDFLTHYIWEFPKMPTCS